MNYRETVVGAAEQVGRNDIYVINPDEYNLLAGMSAEDAQDMPDGLYLVDDTLRDRLSSAGIDYDDLSRSVMDNIRLTNIRAVNEKGEDGEPLKVGRHRSKHEVFFGSLYLGGPAIDGSEYGGHILVAIKPHAENPQKLSKPYREIGNLALMQDLQMPGIYKPLGLVQRGGVRYVLTEQKPGVRTLDDHNWMKTGDAMPLTSEDREAVRERDTALISRMFGLLGTLHAQGIFHGDAQKKNTGWAAKHHEAPVERELASVSALSKAEDLLQIDMTIVDVENSRIFNRESDGDFGDEYYQRLPELALKDLTMFFESLTKNARFPRPGFDGDKRVHKYSKEEEQQIIEDYVDYHYVSAYMQAFTRQRQKIVGVREGDEQLAGDLHQDIMRALHKYTRPRTKKRHSKEQPAPNGI